MPRATQTQRRGRGAFPGSRGALLTALLATASCVSRSPSPEDFLAAGHRTPLQTLDVFRDALAADLPELEYRCLSSGFVRRHGVNLLGYAEARDELPFFRKAADAEVESQTALPDGRVEFVLCLDHAFGEEWFRVRLVREDYWELWSGDALLSDDLAPFDESVRPSRGNGPPSLVAELVLDGVPIEDVTEVRIGQDWKIDSFETIDPRP